FLTKFYFEKKEYDEEFYQLDGWIERYTQTIDGYIGMESYTDAGQRKNRLIIITGRPANQWSY
ncbi:hypothetical protein SEEH3343_13901, partial [Salmonella enterica subsp. enterica serovar Heidelberg str. RI-11-013343]